MESRYCGSGVESGYLAWNPSKGGRGREEEGRKAKEIRNAYAENHIQKSKGRIKRASEPVTSPSDPLASAGRVAARRLCSRRPPPDAGRPRAEPDQSKYRRRRCYDQYADHQSTAHHTD
jgi:hypothetical protein